MTNRDEAIRALDDRYRRRARTILKIAKWPAIGVLIGGSVLIIGRVLGPAIADQLGEQAGAGFARGMMDAQVKIAAIRRQLSISGWGDYR